jgi:pyruvate/2-oxoglutarate/acetoin dehydrogenase E1 component
MTARAERRLSIRDAVLEAITIEMENDPSVVVIGQDVGRFGGALSTYGSLYDRFGADRIIETGISESAAVSLALGASLAGHRPIVDLMFGDFIVVAANALLSQVANFAYMTGGEWTPQLVIRTRGGDGPYRAHPQNLEALLGHVPGLTVVVPSAPADAYDLMLAAIRMPGPVVFVEPLYLLQGPRQPVEQGRDPAPIGAAAVLRRGSDVSVVSYGRSMRMAQVAAGRLEREGIDCELVDLRTVVPFDKQTVLESVGRTGRLLVVHDAWLRGGIGAEVTATVAEEAHANLVAPPMRLGAPNIPVPYSHELRDATLPTSQDIVDAVRALVGNAQ